MRSFVAARIGLKPSKVKDDSDIERDLGCTGDDFFELMEAYQKEHDVDMSGFLWYFHSYDEASATFSPFTRHTPTDEVERIPVTVALLTECANQGRWFVDYPQHTLSNKPRITIAERIFTWALSLFVLFMVGRKLVQWFAQ